MNATVQDAINEQINSEFEASYTYLAMAGFCEQQKFLGAAKWLRMQSDEERQHGMKLFDFVLARDGEVALKAIAQPQALNQAPRELKKLKVCAPYCVSGIRCDAGDNLRPCSWLQFKSLQKPTRAASPLKESRKVQNCT